MSENTTSKKLTIAAAVLFLPSFFLPISNAHGVSRGFFVGQVQEPAMLIMTALGFLAVVLALAFGLKSFSRKLGFGVAILGILNSLITLGLLATLGSELGIGLLAILAGSFAITGAGITAIIAGKKKKAQSQAVPV